ncbi:MAG: ROK family protein, partial [Oscillospiraceae bacterium]|nr:ROK family protein [Oscillospiraceae bacterium]
MYRIGIDLGGTNTVAGLMDEQGRLLETRSVKTNLPTTLDTIVENIRILTQQILEANGLDRQQICSVGVGVPCTADPKAGWMLDADHLGFSGGPLTQRLEAVLGMPVAVGNDANCAALGEYKAGGYDCNSLILVTLGTGIGGGLIIDGKLVDGVNHAAGEVGHMMLYANGRPCTCGRKGCFEAHGSATAL